MCDKSRVADAPTSDRFEQIPLFDTGGIRVSQQSFAVPLEEAEAEDQPIDPAGLSRDLGAWTPPRSVFAVDARSGRAWNDLPGDVANLLGQIARWDGVWHEDRQTAHGGPDTPV